MTYKKFVPGRWKIGQGSLCPPPPPLSLTANTWLAAWEARYPAPSTPREPLHWNDEFQRIGSSNIENTRSFLLSESDYKSSERALALLHNTSSGNCWKIETKLKCVVKTDWKMSNNDILIGNKLILSCWKRELTTFIFHCLKSEICLRSWKHFKYGSVGVDFIPSTQTHHQPG